LILDLRFCALVGHKLPGNAAALKNQESEIAVMLPESPDFFDHAARYSGAPQARQKVARPNGLAPAPGIPMWREIEP